MVLYQYVRTHNSHYEKFIATGEVKCIDDEIPFEIPESWEWVRMKDLITFVNGRAYKKEELLSKGKYKVLRVGNFFTNQEWYYSNLELPEDKYCYDEDLLYAWSASFGPQIWNGGKTIFHYHIWNVKYNPIALYRDYLYYFLLIDKTHIKNSTTGSTMIHVSMENMMPRLLPIPPLAEQKRIVTRIEKLLPFVEKYSEVQNNLDVLNSTINEALKKSILQEAIQGKLVPQDPNDEPASVLLQRIKEEKERLIKEKKIKRDKNESTIFRGDDNRYYEQIGKRCVCVEEDIPFEIPNSWVWARLSYVADIYTGNSMSETEKNLKFSNVEGRFYIGTKDVGFNNLITYNNGVAIPKQYECQFKIAPNNSVLMCIEGGSAGRKIAILNQDVCFGNKLCCFAPFVEIGKYIYYYLQSPSFIEMFNGNKTGIIGGVSIAKVKEILIPLPPQQEQQRIVAKIDEITGIMRG